MSKREKYLSRLQHRLASDPQLASRLQQREESNQRWRLLVDLKRAEQSPPIESDTLDSLDLAIAIQSVK